MPLPRTFTYEIKCKICSSKFLDGSEARASIETWKAEGYSQREIMEKSRERGLVLNSTNVVSHFSKHASYVKKGTLMSAKSKHAITQITRSSEEASTALKKIIAYGNKMIDNWWEGKEGEPQLPITGKLFMEAVKEDGRRSPKTAIDTEFEDLERQMIEATVPIEGEVVKDDASGEAVTSKHSTGSVQEKP